MCCAGGACCCFAAAVPASLPPANAAQAGKGGRKEGFVLLNGKQIAIFSTEQISHGEETTERDMSTQRVYSTLS
jgi:hypothetical protein